MFSTACCTRMCITSSVVKAVCLFYKHFGKFSSAVMELLLYIQLPDNYLVIPVLPAAQ